MKRYKIKEAFNLKAAKMRLMHVGQYYATESEEEQAELARFAAMGSCEEITSVEKPGKGLKPTAPAGSPKVEEPREPAEAKEADPEKDLTVLPGIGKAARENLEKAGVKTVAQLKEAMAKRSEEMRELLGDKTFEKVTAYFAE